MWHGVLLALGVTAGAFASAEDSTSQLLRLVTLSRHGSRAPNGVVAHICPTNSGNLNAYKVPLEQLTEIGMRQMLAAGEYVRKVYVEEKGFLSPSLNGVNHTHFEAYFRADAATRCHQSATALGYGLYPDGTGPKGFPHEPVPVTMQLLKNEHEFAAPKGPCAATLHADLGVYAETRALELLDENQKMLEKVGEICGVSVEQIPTTPGGEDLVLGVKDIADMFIFDRDEELPPTKGLTTEISAQIEQLAFTNLMERYYSTDREITYWVGGFADLLLNNLNSAAKPTSPSPTEYRYYSYHGHRELLHGLGKMLGWNFDFEGLPKALGMTALHPATTMAFELHTKITRDDTEAYFVKTFIWSPKTGREQVKLEKCSSLECPLDEFNAIITKHISKTGTWQEICNFGIPAQNQHLVQQGSSASVTDDASTGTAGVWSTMSNGLLVVLGAAFAACLVFAAYKAVMRVSKMRREGYMPI
uniref:Acid phosphatase n=1 Tax=Globisporangium ultimum (strain ATCC 200006 / CBS 805.95 / DAOM BR144) TaxID=431595 RepID=K3WPM1_GLOUD